jgi:23S rRNA pseudouridine1911/1915/1917 synthase
LVTNNLKIIFEDDQLIVLNKPAGIHVFPGVWNWLKAKRPNLADVGDKKNPAILHRLDQHTSGLLLAAKDNPSYDKLRAAFKKRRIEKFYLALVEDRLSERRQIDLSLGSRYRRSKKVSIAEADKNLRSIVEAQTIVTPLGGDDRFTFCQVQIITGVRHQIRAHLAHIGHPIVGDKLYGAKQKLESLGDRYFLHAWKLAFEHPKTDEKVFYECPLEKKLTVCLWVALRAKYKGMNLIFC